MKLNFVISAVAAALFMVSSHAADPPATEVAQLAKFVNDGQAKGAFKKMDRTIQAVRASSDEDSVTVEVFYSTGAPQSVASRARVFAEGLADTMVDKYKRDLGARAFPYKFYVNSWMATKNDGVHLRVLRTRYLPRVGLTESEVKRDLVSIQP